MKKITLSLVMITIALTVIAQTPQAFKYQAVARDNAGNVIATTNVTFRISILQGSAGGTSVCTETYDATTNEFGLVNLEIGNGEPETGSFSEIDWGNGPYYLQVEMDENGGESYQSMGTYHMWYSGSVDFLHREIGYATSTNGINWDKDYVFSPVISYGPPGSFYDVNAHATGQIVHNDTIRMFFGGSDGTNNRIGYAYSTDYTTWTVDNNDEPVVDVGEAGSWDDLHVCYPSVMVHDGQYKMWYNGGAGTGARIGYAFTDPLVGLPDNKHSTQGKISISPNPLSTKARIEYELIEPGHVNLIIFNHISQPIETLINQYQPRGQHQITWVAEGLASGIYFYSLQAGGQSATGKMVVLR